MSGCVIPRTPIAVDSWKRSNSQAKLFFLSHMHSDHTVSLNSSWKQTIYCSEITKRLAIEKFDIEPSVLVAIPIGQSTILNLDEIGIEKLTVTLIDANHCPGAVMFLFEGYFGRILHTGDFRYVEGMLDNIVPFQTNPSINTLYLDNTYCKPGLDFPTRIDATIMIIDIIIQHPNHDIVIGLDTLGKEDLLCRIAKVVGLPITVDKYRYHTTKLMGCSVDFTTDTDASCIRVVPRCQVNKYTVSLWNKEHPTIVIFPTCRFIESTQPYEDSENIFVVPYSDHSSFSELKKFVATVKPQRIIPVVQRPRYLRSDPREDMSVFNGVKSPDADTHIFDIPASVLNFMSQRTSNIGPMYQRNKRKSVSFFSNNLKRPCGVVFPSSPKHIRTSKEGNTTDKPIDGPTTIKPASEGVLVPITKANEIENCNSDVGKPTCNKRVGTLEGECSCEKNHEDWRDLQESVKKEPEEEHIMETNWAQREYEDRMESKEKEARVVEEVEKERERIHGKGMPVVEEAIHETETQDGLFEMSSKQQEAIHGKGMSHETETKDGLFEMSSKQQEAIHGKGMPVLEEAIHEMETQDGLSEMSSKQQEAALAAEAHEGREAPSKKPNHKNKTLGDYSAKKYCIRQTKSQPSNIYGGSCAFAWRVLQKLKSTRQYK